MATATSVSRHIQDRERVPIPKVDHARLMYYLKCMSSLGPRPGGDPSLKAPRKLTDYVNYRLLSFQEIREVVKWCRLLAPDNPTLAEFVVWDTQGEACKDPKKRDCAFVKIPADCDLVSVGHRSIVASSVKGVGERFVIFYTELWLEEYYTNPLKNVSILHCLHCNGKERRCFCAEGCDRPAKSQCLLLRSNEHYAWCDGCKDPGYIVGIRYKCTVCTNYDLCRGCYEDRKVDDLTHPFTEIVSYGAIPVLLPARQAPQLSPPYVPPLPVASVKGVIGKNMATSPTTSPTCGMPSPTASTLTVNSGSQSAKPPFTKDDAVVLKGLARVEMNGQEATVLSVDAVTEKAQVRIVATGKAFKVKWANMEVVEELEELEDMEEELE